MQQDRYVLKHHWSNLILMELWIVSIVHLDSTISKGMMTYISARNAKLGSIGNISSHCGLNAILVKQEVMFRME
jgi:hypothetical protein